MLFMRVEYFLLRVEKFYNTDCNHDDNANQCQIGSKFFFFLFDLLTQALIYF